MSTWSEVDWKQIIIMLRNEHSLHAQCDPNCVDGTHTRSVWCETVPEGVVVADVLCGCNMKPASSELCTNVSGLDQCFLVPLWRVGEFSEVSGRQHKLCRFCVDCTISLSAAEGVLGGGDTALWSVQC